MEIGIVGLPNVGKSSLFNALTGAQAASENFPFTTIEPNVGIVPLDDPRLHFLAEKFSSQKTVPAGIRFTDIAGLVKGASQGEGLGNKFLSNVRTVDAIAHVVRCFEDDNVVNVMEELNPLEAIDIIETELLLADLQQAQNNLEKLKKSARSGDKEAKEKMELLEKIIQGFDQGIAVRNQGLESEFIKGFQFLTSKPVLYVANVDESNMEPPILEELKKHAASQNAGIISLCVKLEAEIVQMPEEERKDFYDAAGITSPGLFKLANAGKELLGMITYFTAGKQEARAWLIRKGMLAPQAAGVIHTDFERGFIRAETYKFDDFKELGSEVALKEKGLIRLEGKEYVVEDGDVMLFRFNV